MENLKLILLPDMNEDDWANIEMKGWFPGAYVLTPDHLYFPVTFVTPQTLKSQVDYNLAIKRYYGEDHIIVIAEITMERMQAAIQTAWQDGLFRVSASNPYDPKDG